MFKIYKVEVEKQLELKIKVVRSDRGGEYYGRFDKAGRNPSPFARYLQEEGIIAQYTNSGTPQQNGVSVRRNRTLKDMVRSMMCCTNLPIFLWGEALKTANYILNRVPTKSVDKIPFKIWNKRKPILNHLKVWGCKAEEKLYNPVEKKLDSRTVSFFFIGYPEGSKRYRFYCPKNTTRFVETQRAVFMENGSDEIEDRVLDFDEESMEIDNIAGSKTSKGIVIIPAVETNCKNLDNMKEDTVQTEILNPLCKTIMTFQTQFKLEF
ncbi:hypothetical protein L3X38_022503 [Prunus dulcis]|uniref:Integrase catalytic domain-containing protein n=1 Tax=Prunus dulcis TaxID=3755 RepID=A0AAD4VXR5_PRUDU|nr:hypothetical protein L3X38_022503 [Prunus dulcis]